MGNRYIIAKSEYNLYIYSKELKFLKKIPIGWDKVYELDGDTLYMKGIDKNYKIDLKTFKETTLKKLSLKRVKKQEAYFSKVDHYIYYKNYVTKAREPFMDIYETNKYIIAVGYKKVYIYNKQLKLLKEILLDKRVKTIFCGEDGVLYYTIYDKIFRYKLEYKGK